MMWAFGPRINNPDYVINEHLKFVFDGKPVGLELFGKALGDLLELKFPELMCHLIEIDNEWENNSVTGPYA